MVRAIPTVYLGCLPEKKKKKEHVISRFLMVSLPFSLFPSPCFSRPPGSTASSMGIFYLVSFGLTGIICVGGEAHLKKYSYYYPQAMRGLNQESFLFLQPGAWLSERFSDRAKDGWDASGRLSSLHSGNLICDFYRDAPSRHASDAVL